jgi:hypothetical protein
MKIDKDVLKDIYRKVDEVFVVPLDEGDSNLKEQITLGSNWDNPYELSKAMDRQPMWYGQWATLLRELKREREKLQLMYKAWESERKEKLTEIIFQSNKKKGMTSNQAKPSASVVNDRFNSFYIDVNGKYHKKYKKVIGDLNSVEERIDRIEVVVKVMEQRKDMLISLSSLIRTMIDNHMLIKTTKKHLTKTKNK